MRKHLSYANVMASIAVFVALGGSAYAASKITGKNIKNGSITGTDIKASTIGEGKLKPSARAAETRWFLLSASGDIAEQSGGFTVTSKPGLNDQPATNPNVYVETGDSLVGHGITATTAIENTLDRTGDGMPDPSFKGDVSVGRCASESINCVPTGTNTESHVVVRSLTDNATATSPGQRAYVVITP